MQVEGDVKSFSQNWKTREEAYLTHWTPGEPRNQIQMAFRNHWTLFNQLMKNVKFNGGKRCLEVGCGRGSLSHYFAEAEYKCTLVDLSKDAIEIAQKSFADNNFNGKFHIEDANKLTFSDNSFDIVFSIGLFEHFKDIETPIKEQIRVLDKGGIFFGYVVPEYSGNIQKDFHWINEILEVYQGRSEKIEKHHVYRSDEGSLRYVKTMQEYGLEDVHASGVYPLPMISHSIEFPFSLMPEEAEAVLVGHFEKILNQRRRDTGKHPWLCEEGYGQAFLVWGFKK